MSFPDSLTTRTVTGRFVTFPNGVGAPGYARIILSDLMQGPTDNAFVAPFDVTFKFDSNGEFSCVLPATNDPQWSPSFYRLIVGTQIGITRDTTGRRLPMYRTKGYRLEIPYDGPATIDLADIVNVGLPQPGQLYVVRSQLGVANGVATLGTDGKVIPSQLPTSAGGSVEWDEIDGKPTTFPPDPISWTDVQDKPTTFPGTAAWDDVTNKPTTFPSTPAWTEVTGKPSTFPPSAHNHVTSEVTGLDTALAAKASETELTAGLSGKSDVGHTHAQTDVTGLSTALSSKADAAATTTALSAKADASTVTTSLASKADLVGGVIPTAQLPAIAVIDFLGSVSTQTAMLALTGQKGDWCIRTDLGQTWVITGATPSQLASWTPMPLASVPVQTVNGQTGTVVLGATDVGLGNVDNTSDANKPVSTAQQTALNLKAPLASPTFTGTVSGVTAAMVGLGSVNNTADTAKPVSTAQQTALDAKAPLASPTFTGTVSGITKTMVGLGSVDNTADTAKPVSTAQQTALDAKAPLASPTLTGTPAAPTAAAGTSTTQLATTAFVTTADNLKAPLASPTLTGTPAAPTAAVGTNTTQLATTAFVLANHGYLVLSAAASVPGGTPAGTIIFRTAT